MIPEKRGPRKAQLSSPSASVKAASAMEPSATMKPSAKTRVSTGGVGPGDATVVKTAERTGVRAGLAVWRSEPMLRTGDSSRSWATMKVAGAVTEIVAIDERSAMGDVRVVVIDDRAVMPVESPAMPSPAKTAEVANSKTCTERNRGAANEDAGNRIPSGPHR